MTNKELDKILDTIGGRIEDTPEAWAAVAMGCIDQAMLSVAVQDQITAILRAAGVDHSWEDA
jgi:hypothetical protein